MAHEKQTSGPPKGFVALDDAEQLEMTDIKNKADVLREKNGRFIETRKRIEAESEAVNLSQVLANQQLAQVLARGEVLGKKYNITNEKDDLKYENGVWYARDKKTAPPTG